MSIRVVVLAAFLLVAPIAWADHNININTADKTTLETLTGIGPSKAQAIIDYRNQYSSFATIEDIQNVSGIGPATYANIKDHITVQGGNSTAPSPEPTPAPAPSSSSVAPSPQSSAASASALSVDGGADRAAIVGADVQFSARAYSGKTIVENAAFSWNFGDGSTAQGAYVSHRFEYAGRYAVVLTGSHDGATASDSFSVTAEVAQLSVRVLSDGGVEIENLSSRDVDLSRWIVQSGGQRFTIPENTIVFARQKMSVSPNTLHFFASDSTELQYPSGVLAFHAKSESLSPAPDPSPLPPPAAIEPAPTVAQVRIAPVAPSPEPKNEKVEEIEQAMPIDVSSQLAAAGVTSSSWPWWLGAASISLGAAASIFFARRFGKKEWDIVEDAAE